MSSPTAAEAQKNLAVQREAYESPDTGSTIPTKPVKTTQEPSEHETVLIEAAANGEKTETLVRTRLNDMPVEALGNAKPIDKQNHGISSEDDEGHRNLDQEKGTAIEAKTTHTAHTDKGEVPQSHDASESGVIATSTLREQSLSSRHNESETKLHAEVPTDITSSSEVASRRSTPSPPPPPPKDTVYLDPTPKTPLASVVPSRTPSRTSYTDENGPKHGKHPVNAPRTPSPLNENFDSQIPSHDIKDENDDTKSEIQSIMDQFDEEGGGPGEEEVMSPRLELATPFMQHPPRKSSLEPIRQASTQNAHANQNERSPESSRSLHDATKSLSLIDSDISPPVPPKPSTISAASPTAYHDKASPRSPDAASLSSISKANLPMPDPEPDLPFDFHRFLEQLRHRSADPVAGFLRSFLNGFGRKQWLVHEQVKFVSDFLIFITGKMEQCEVWREVSDAEFDNAREGMEKLVMNRLYAQTFSPAIPPPQSPNLRGKSKQSDRPNGGRRGQHQEDVERDDVLAQKVQIYGWVEEKHLDIPPIGTEGRKFLRLAQKELLKIKGYRAPRDKIICVLNCCKVIFGLLRRAGSDSSADSFVPLLILVVLQANPEHLVSNVQYILRFRNQSKLVGEAGYYLSSLMGAVQFIESLDKTTLTIDDAEFEKNVELAVSAIAEKHKEKERHLPSRQPVQISEKASQGESSRPRPNANETPQKSSRHEGSATDGSHDTADDDLTPAGLLRTIQKPLSSIGRMFTDENVSEKGSFRPSPEQRSSSSLGLSPPKSNLSLATPQRISAERARNTITNPTSDVHAQLSAQDAAARQASAEAAQARRIQQAEHKNVIETLTSMFPNLDKDVIDDVVRMKEGRVGLAVDACLALSNTS